MSPPTRCICTHCSKTRPLLNSREGGHIDSLDVTMVGFKAHNNLALVYQYMGRFYQAAAHFGQAVQAEPGFVPSWLGLRELLVRGERWDEVRAVEAWLAGLGMVAQPGYRRWWACVATPT